MGAVKQRLLPWPFGPTLERNLNTKRSHRKQGQYERVPVALVGAGYGYDEGGGNHACNLY
jgi:hypothetical protein